MATSKNRFRTVDEYIAMFPRNIRDLLQELRRTIREAAPEAQEMISYGVPAFKLQGKGLVYFGGWKSHVGFYVGTSAIEAFKKELSPFKLAKGTIQFPLDKPIPSELVKKIVKFRIKDECKEDII
ncbi:MAG: iron chaperone [Candidatus Bathyarchaeia archaeon]